MGEREGLGGVGGGGKRGGRVRSGCSVHEAEWGGYWWGGRVGWGLVGEEREWGGVRCDGLDGDGRIGKQSGAGFLGEGAGGLVGVWGWGCWVERE